LGGLSVSGFLGVKSDAILYSFFFFFPVRVFLCAQYIGSSAFRIWTDACQYTPKSITVDGLRTIAVSPVTWYTQLRQFNSISDTIFGAASNYFRNTEERNANLTSLGSFYLFFFSFLSPLLPGMDAKRTEN
jgi:hypothetical protein